MAGITGYGWGKTKVSAWKQFEAWREARKAATANLMASNENFNALFSQAHSAKIEGTAKLAMEAAVNRVNMAAKAKFDLIANTKVEGLDDIGVDKTV